MRDNKEFFNTLRDVIIADIGFHVLTTVSIVLIIASFFVPPLGVIDPSVMAGIGEMFAFAALWELHVGLRKGISAKVSHRDTSIELSKKKDNENNEND